MCQFVSFFHKPSTGEIFVKDLNSHSETERFIPPGVWREGHYLPDGTIDARVTDEDRESSEECASRIQARWPRFTEFLGWCFREPGVLDEQGTFNDHLDLSDLKTPKGLPAFPQEIRGSLYLGSLTTPKGLPAFPTTIGGDLDLNGLTSLKGLPALPKKIGGDLYLSKLPSAEGLQIPKGVRVYTKSGRTTG